MPCSTTTFKPKEPIAVVGIGCRFPGGASSPSKLWEILEKPRDLLKKVPIDRFNIDSVYHADGSFHGRTNAPYAYFLDENIRAFDANFFNIQHHEAEVTDPQHRLLLETVYEALEAAGIRVEDLRGSPTAVYCGQMMNDYKDLVNFDLDGLPTYAATGTAASILSNRVSYFFDWHGPSMTIDTACSSSLVAVHHAVQQLRTGSSKVAIAAGANLILGPVPFIVESKMNMLSPTGRSSMWDEKANGYARGEGVAAVVLKTLSQALSDGDNIECIIRETGVNQDGRSPGITMPSHRAQEALIRETYAAAGLDLSRAEDRCQYFEAHGTGTSAGDPQEAEAIARSFFGSRGRSPEEAPLYVGSIKTVIGHAEGTAGVAGLIKASLAMQHRVIPPNMLFDKLSPKVAPFYQNLHVPSKAQPWPELPPDVPIRASVNSFGFGGTNAHVILEAHPDSELRLRRTSQCSSAVPIWPIPITANSELSLKATAQDLLQYLRSASGIQIQDLAWTLTNRRSVLPVRRALTAQTIPGVCAALEATIASIDKKEGLVVSSLSTRKPKVLGVFTGQGAQWSAMGKILISAVPHARNVISQLDQSLSSLPPRYRPSWTLYDQLMLEGDSSNVYDARFSQPLCCAIQIILVQMLTATGIKFEVVVGHSSGEIACAYAAGFITASKAIRIAYLRGLVSDKAASPSGVEGAMLAAGCSQEDAEELCGLNVFRGRICVAASNAPDSVTISGDADAIEEAREVLEDESKFARQLKVNKAYHSFHMKPCAEPYMRALQDSECDAVDANTTSTAEPSTVWISSVQAGHRMRGQDVTANYWKDNLLSPVLFSQAVEHVARNLEPVDLAIEVGCHPALKGPCLKTIKECVEPGAPELPYVGCMRRGADDLDAFADALGYVWERFGTESVSLAGLNEILPQTPVNSLAKALPPYPWDRSKSYWLDTRRTRFFLRGGEPKPHLLLGKLSADSTSTALQWRNSIRPRDISWLDSHQLQGQTVFPGAGYVVMVAEAAMHVAKGRSVQLLEVFDVEIFKAVTFDNESSLVELSLSLEVYPAPASAHHVSASFRIDCCLSREDAMSPSTSGKLIITYGPGAPDTLPVAHVEPPHMSNISVDAFYKELSAVGYGYTNDFRGLSSMRRADFKACGSMRLPHAGSADGDDQLLLHPATLDNAFQTLIAAVSAPGDGLMRSLLVPTSIGRIALNPWLCGEVSRSSEEVHYNATSTTSRISSISGDIEVFDPRTGHIMFQVEGISTKAASAATKANDHTMFMHWEWDRLVPDKLLNRAEYAATDADREVASAMERIVYFYIRSFLEDHAAEKLADLAPHHQTQIRWFQHKMDEARQGRSLFYQAEWERDQQADIQSVIARHEANSHVRLIQRVGEGLRDVFFDGRNAFELMDHDGLLSEFYGSDSGFGPAYYYMQHAIAPILHRYQKMDILEIGAGTGGATRYILDQDPAPAFNSYTFTDISTSFFEKAHETFAQFEDKMEFQALDVRRSPVEQGFTPHSYDLIIASNVLHATPNLQETMANVRTLLKPGGNIVVVELTSPRHSRIGFIFGLFADWWAGVDDDRVLQPYVSIERWDGILRKTGFSGVASKFEDPEDEIFPTSVFRSEAVNDKVARLYEPLLFPARDPSPTVVVVGGATPKSSRICRGIQKILPARRFELLQSLEDVGAGWLGSDVKPTFLVLSELDDPVFAGMNEARFEALKVLGEAAGHMLWVTEDAWLDPVKAMAIGFLRTLRLECVQCGIQVLDVDDADKLGWEYLAETLLRLEECSDWQDAGLLWTLEPEIYVSQGLARIPRLKPNRPMNDRLNSGRREVLADADPKTTPVVLYQDDDAAYLQSNDTYEPDVKEGPGFSCKPLTSRLRVLHSLARAVRLGNFGYFNVVHGISVSSGEAVIALCEENGSLVDAAPDRVAHLPGQARPALLLAVAADLLAQTLVAETAPGAHILIYGAPRIYEDRIAQRVKAKGIRATFASVRPRTAEDDDAAGEDSSSSSWSSWIQLHENMTQLALSRMLPRHVSAFYNFSLDRSPVGAGQVLSKRFAARSCPTFQAEHLASLTASAWTRQTGNALGAMLDESVKVCLAAAAAAGVGAAKDVHATPAQELVTLQRRVGYSTVIDWTLHDVLSARVLPVDSGRLFSDDKTYLLIGLTGDLGRSICRWMLGHGAKHVVLSSRHPQVEDRWLAEMQELGGNVMVLPMDVANQKSLDTGLDMIRKSFPPIGGVAFGPLVLKDVLLKNMQLDQMQTVLHPKVTGARLLQERLDEREHRLEFFVMFSSFVMVCGNPGQSAYSAANAYTHALALRRRACGLAGSTIDMGAIWGVGYIVRQGRDEEYETISFKFDKVSEMELHALFAEAVVVGRPGPSSSSNDATQRDEIEVITGMRFLDPTNKELIPHYDDPRLGHFILREKRESAAGGATTLVSVKERLLEAESVDEVCQIVGDGLAEKLRATLQITHEDGVKRDTPLIDQGVDSLSAVTIGTWFSKNLNLELPVLKILGGASINDLAEEAAERLPPSATPLVHCSDLKVPVAVQSSSDDSASSRSSDTEPSSVSTSPPLTAIPGNKVGDTLPFERKASMSLNQEYSWKMQRQSADPTRFNSTIGMYMKGYIDLDRMAWAFEAVLRRHKIFQTRFPSSGETVQIIMDAPRIRFRAVPVADRAAAEQGFKDVDGQSYDLAAGDTLKLVDFYWAPDEHIVIIAYNQLVCDGWTYERLFVELAQIYDGNNDLPPAPQYADFAARQRAAYEKGGMDADLAYWKSLHEALPEPLPVLSLPPGSPPAAAGDPKPPPSWDQHVLKARVSPATASRIRNVCRRSKATPMQFYLASYYVLLARLTGRADMAIGVADANRPDLDDLSTMGLFLNMLLLRLGHTAGDTFASALSRAREHMRGAVLHSRAPMHVVLEGLGVDSAKPHAFMQAVFDYKQGQAESGALGEAHMAGVLASRSRTPYDITLEMSDDPSKSPLLTFKLQSSQYSPRDVREVMGSFMSLLDAFSRDQGTLISEAQLDWDDVQFAFEE